MRLNRRIAPLGLLHATVPLGAYASNNRPISYTNQNGTWMMFNEQTVLSLISDGKTPAVVVLDYGRDVEGLAFFDVARKSGDTSIFEMTYSETRALVDSEMGDGPLPLAAAMDTYRVNRFNITEPKVYLNRLLQGGLRYQKLNLSSAGEVELSSIGFRPTVSTTAISDLPGSFSCSDPVLSRIWESGAYTVQLNELPANSTPDFWTITHEGAFVDSLAPQPLSTDWSPMLTAYELQFSVKPKSGGFGFTVLSDTLGSGIYIFVNIVNSSISAHVGSSDLSDPLASAALPSSVTLNKWQTVRSAVNMTEISVQVDNTTVFNFSQSAAFYGSFGLGASLGHSATFADLSLSVSGKQVYSTSLTDTSFLEHFLLGTNPLPVSVDGSRRDRIAYAGDLEMTTGTALASTQGQEYINGSIELLGSYQLPPGFFVPNAKVQQLPRTTPVDANITGLIGYSFSMVSAMALFYEQTGDANFLSRWAPKAAKMFDWAHSQTLPNGLFNLSDASMGGDWNYYDPALSGVVTKFYMIYAYSLSQWIPYMEASGINKTMYEERLGSLQNAINKYLWSPSQQACYLSESHRDFFSQEANALAVLSDTASHRSHSPKAVLATMARELTVPAGALAFSTKSAASGWAQKISPYASGYHLKAAFYANDGDSAIRLLRGIWGPMSDPLNANYTGCFWEVLSEDGTPGIGSPTSMCHAWSSGPTADLNRYVLGIQPVTPGFKNWQVVPQSLDLNWAHGKHPIPNGRISVYWSFDKAGLLRMEVKAPDGTNGTVHLPVPLKRKLNKYRASGFVSDNKASFVVQGGMNFTFHQMA
ncbi:unnamed protein product [Penicillium olsonii]|nr:unnamed protein product [Penicillium olsonii]